MVDLRDKNNTKKANVCNQNASDITEILILHYKTYGNLIILPLIVTTVTTLSIYLLHLLTNESLIHQKFLILKFVTNIKKHPIWNLLVNLKMEILERRVEYIQS